MALLFELNIQGVRGFGLGASTEIDNWIANAEAIIASDATVSIQKVPA